MSELAHKVYPPELWSTDALERKNARSLLLYLETRAVDHRGRVNLDHMNDRDMERATAWAESGFIEFGRIASGDFNLRTGTHWVRLPLFAMEEAARLRQLRARRGFDELRTYQTTAEKREGRTPPGKTA